MLSSWLAFVLISAFGRATGRPDRTTVIPLCITLVILPLCGGSGLVLLPPMVLWLAGYLCWGWWSGHEPGGWARAFGLSSLMACSAIVALYLSDYGRPAGHPLPPSLWAVVSTTLRFLSLSINSGATKYWMATSLTTLALTGAALVRLSLVAVRLPHERPRAFGLAAVIMSMMGLALSVGVSRSGLDPVMGLSPRYVTLAAPLLSVLYFTWLLYTPARSQRFLQSCLLLVVCVNMPYALNRARQSDKSRLQCYKRVERGLKAGISRSQFVNVACPGLVPDRNTLAEFSKMLKESGFGNFKYLQDDQQAAQIAVTTRPDTKRR